MMYRRWISYLYIYESGERKENVGFLRVERQAKWCKIIIQITPNLIPAKEGSVFFIGDSENGGWIVQVGKLTYHQGGLFFRKEVSCDNIDGSGRCVNDTKGLLVAANGLILAASWDDRSIDIGKYTELMKDEEKRDYEVKRVETADEMTRQMRMAEEAEVDREKNEAAAAEMKEAAAEIKVVKTEVVAEKAEKAKTEVAAAKAKAETMTVGTEKAKTEVAAAKAKAETMTVEAEKAKTEAVAEKAKAEMMTVETEKAKTEAVAEKAKAEMMTVGAEKTKTEAVAEEMKMEVTAAEKAKDDLPRVFGLCPRVYPFEDGELSACVRLELHDIGLLPVSAWGYINNSFLLHAFYSYGSLIFAIRETPRKKEALLMIPGIYCQKELRMARRFGFPNFKCIRNTEKMQGEFGYWYIGLPNFS